VRAAIFLRTLAVQGSWNYESMIGNGIAFAVEPALRLLPGGPGGEAYRAALARQGGYFNAHPYLASVAIGALARAELDGERPETIERFRTACCGPLGSVGDRLVWAGWLPLCALLALAAFGLGTSPAGVVLLFLGSYNAGHVALRVWGLRAGYQQGLRVAGALGTPLLRQGPAHLARATALLAGIGLPVAVRGVIGPARGVLFGVMAAAAIGAFVLARLQGRVEGWRLAVAGFAAFILYSVVR
jgi:PTS system mannose-specific IID component